MANSITVITNAPQGVGVQLAGFTQVGDSPIDMEQAPFKYIVGVTSDVQAQLNTKIGESTPNPLMFQIFN